MRLHDGMRDGQLVVRLDDVLGRVEPLDYREDEELD
jgi:hypothetical protein